MSSSHGQSRRTGSRSSKSSSSKSSGSRQQPQQLIFEPEDPGLSFIFIVNELAVTEDANTGCLTEMEGGRWVPPVWARGFRQQQPGRVYRWNNGHVTTAEGYSWYHYPIPADGINEAASGTVATPDRIPLTRHRSATVFFANPFIKYKTAPGDVTARNMYESGEIWHHLRFRHVGPYGNISYVDHVAEEDYIYGRSDTYPWHKQLIPQAYECQDEHAYPSGGLAGLLPILISLVAFSCSSDRLNDVLLQFRSWRNRNWVRHDRHTGRRERRGMVVTVYLDPENPVGSTRETLSSFEEAEDGRPIFRPGVYS